MTKLDHLVLATPNLPAAVAAVTRRIGIAPVEGGRHVGIGTRNYLLGLGDGGYLEIIGPDTDQPKPQRPRSFGIDNLTEPRLVTWAARVEGIDAVVTAARAAGFDPGEVSDMSRTTPDGQTLRWRLTLSRDGSHSDVVPFLIDWGDTPHPSASLPQAKLRSLHAVHPDVETAATRLRALSADLTVEAGIRPALIATIEGPHGAITLL